MNSDLLRQRRNLIIISTVLLIFDFAKVTIIKISVLGIELLVGNVQVLMVCAWILWAYFFLRYYQYWQTQRDRHLRDTFLQKFDEYVRLYTGAKAKNDGFCGSNNNYKVRRIAFAKWNYVLQEYAPKEDILKDGLTYNLPVWKLFAWSVQSAIFVCLQTPHATDHVLPFALAVAAPITTIYTNL